MRPICSGCQTEMRPFKNGVVVVTFASFGPYELREADEWECKSCGLKIIMGFAKAPYAEHWQDGFQSSLDNIPHGLRRENHERVYS